MKKIILKTTALLIALAGLFASCSLFEDDDDDSPSGLIVAPAFNKAVLSLSVAGEGAARTALPSVSSAQEFESFDFEANKGTDRITKSWTGDSEKTAYAKMTSESFEIDAGTWTFTLTAKKGGMTYKGSIEKEITAGANIIEFTLSLSELSNEGKGSVEIKLSVPETVIAVTATLCNTSENAVSDSSITQSTNLANNTVSYTAQNVPSGTYLVVFNLYADTSKTLLLGKWREYAGITSDVTSKSEIAIAAEDLDKVYTITYELNGGILRGNWAGNYTRQNLDIQIPDATSVIKNCKVFDCWYCDEAFTKLFCTDNLKEGNITLYAKWRNYKASEVAPAINNGTLTGIQSEPASIVVEGGITSNQLGNIASAMKSKQCYLSLDLSKATGLSSVGNEFKNCTHLTEISIPKTVTSIGEYAFDECRGLTSVTIPDSVTSIGRSAFYNCRGLTSVTIPDSVTSIGRSAFYNCRGLTSVTIPDSVTSIGEGAFYGCSGLKSVTIPSSVKSIGRTVFYGCSGLTSVTIPSSVKSIGWEAFQGCSGLTSVIIPNSVNYIDYYAFSYCRGLTSVKIPSSVKRIEYGAFTYCNGLESVYYDGILEQWLAISFKDGGSNPCCNGSDLYIQGKQITDLVIPSSVTSIGKNAFSGCSGLKSVTIPSSVTSIGEYAFSGCSKLESVTIPSSVTSIGEGAFWGCSGLTSVTIAEGSKGLWIKESAFCGCSGFTSVTIPRRVREIKKSAFSGCSGLTNVNYRGSNSQWCGIKIYSEGNEPLKNATKTYNYTGE